MRRQIEKASERIRSKTKKAKERKRLIRLYPWAASEARGLRKDPGEIPEKILRKLEMGLRDRKFRESRGAR